MKMKTAQHNESERALKAKPNKSAFRVGLNIVEQTNPK